MLNDSVIICDVFPKSTRKKAPLGSKKQQKSVRKTFYESPLKHIQLSNKRREQIQKQRKLMKNTKRTINNTTNVFSVIDTEFQDSIIILSDSESKNNTKSKKRPLKKSTKDKQTIDNSLCTSNKSSRRQREVEIETCLSKKRKLSSTTFSDSSCLLISDTENSETTNSRDHENIEPSKSINQGSDDIFVVWSSTETSSSENQSEGNKIVNHEKDYRFFMVDCNPDQNNLSYLKSNKTTVSKICEENIEKDHRKDSNLLFNKPDLKLPKARDISKTIVMEKRKSILNTLANLEKKRSELFHKETTVPSTSTSVNDLQTSLTSQTISEPSNRLREIIVDGNNVAMAHRNGKAFSEEGLLIVIDYFKKRGHTVKVFVPQYRRALTNPLLEKWYTEGIVVFTPSRFIAGKWITSYDDRYILQYATVCKGIVISSDQYRDLYREKPEWRDTIVNRLLAPTFVGDYVMFPEDPLGRNGPTLQEFLRY